MEKTIYYIDQNNNYYVDNNENNYIWKETMLAKRLIPYIRINGSFRRAMPIIVKITNMGPIPNTALLSQSNTPILTKNREYILTTNTQNITNVGNNDYILFENNLHYTPHILYSRNSV